MVQYHLFELIAMELRAMAFALVINSEASLKGRTFDEFTGLPEFDEILSQQIKQLSSGYELRLLGSSPNGDVYVSEEERELNFHILSSSGEGKSKFLEYNIRKDIDAGNGLCLLAPSDFGST